MSLKKLVENDGNIHQNLMQKAKGHLNGINDLMLRNTDDIRKSAPKRTLSDLDSELLNINFFQTPGAFTD